MAAGRSIPLTRRRFLACSATLAGTAALQLIGADATATTRPFRAAIIGHTGRGNYGHDHDLIFAGRDNIQVVAVADPDEAGRTKAVARTRALKGYADYREMLEKEKPELVTIAPRWTDQHHAMAMAALRARAHVYLEKPITRTLAEADELLAEAGRSGLKIEVAHQMRLAPNILLLKQRLPDLLGDLLEIHAHGKQDHRAGGEDLIVLGIHLFDLMRFYAGDPSWCSARILQKGREITLSDAHPATENIGPVAGDELMAEFAFAGGVQGTFVSRARNRGTAGPWGLELVGSEGRIRILTEMVPTIYTLKPADRKGSPRLDSWNRWAEDPTRDLADSEKGLKTANARVVDDWLAAIANNREPVCSGYAAMKALEMAMAVFAAGLVRTRVEMPLRNRAHPLEG